MPAEFRSASDPCVEGVEAVVQGILPDGRVQVVVQRASACASCHAQGVCVPGERETRLLVVRDELGANVGDRVIVGTVHSSAALAGGVAYGIPLLGLLAAGVVGRVLAGTWLQAPERDLIAALCAILGAGLGLGVVAVIDRLWGRRFEVRVLGRMTVEKPGSVGHHHP